MRDIKNETKELIEFSEIWFNDVQEGEPIAQDEIDLVKDLIAALKSQKAITELAVKGLKHYADESFYEFYGMGTAALEDKGDAARSIIKEIERLSHE